MENVGVRRETKSKLARRTKNTQSQRTDCVHLAEPGYQRREVHHTMTATSEVRAVRGSWILEDLGQLGLND